MKNVNKTLTLTLFAAASLSSAAVLAADDETAGSSVSQARTSEVAPSNVYDSVINITPEIGVLGYSDALTNYTSRVAEGFNLDWNIANMVSISGMQMGLETGLLYSHLGSPSSNFFGTNAELVGGEGSNTYLVPATIVAGYKPSDQSVIAFKVGAQLLYQSMAGSINTGRSITGTTATDVFPSLGLNLGYSLSKKVGISLRGDYIPTPAQDMFSTFLGATIGLG